MSVDAVWYRPTKCEHAPVSGPFAQRADGADRSPKQNKGVPVMFPPVSGMTNRHPILKRFHPGKIVGSITIAVCSFARLNLWSTVPIVRVTTLKLMGRFQLSSFLRTRFR